MIQPKVVSREMVKPSIDTPNHPKIHKLSFFDQLSPNFYLPVVYFYTQETCQGVDNTTQKSRILRSSLSTVLSQYYPLAGRMRGDGVSVDCNDEGVVFLEAQIELKLSEFLDNPREEVLQLFFPDGLQLKDANLSTPLVVQLTFFECGGMAIAICISHKLVDVECLSSFVSNWATMTRDPRKEISLEFNMGTLYPPMNLPLNYPKVDDKTISYATTRLVFNKSKIANLKAMVAQEVKNPSKLEVVTAMIWKTAMNAGRASSETPKEKNYFWQAINLRKRLSPPLNEKEFGNFSGGLFLQSNEEDKVDFKWLVRELRQRKVEHSAYCNSASTREELSMMYLEYMKKNVGSINLTNGNMYVCTSWSGYPHYETDFGWGKPTWVAFSGYESTNTIMMIDTRDGDGIEAFITLEEADMALFERDQELLAFATSFNSSLRDNKHAPQRRSKL